MSSVNWIEVGNTGVAIADNLTTPSGTTALAARQGVILDQTKVDKVAGKGLSTNDFTNQDKDAIAGLLDDVSDMQVDIADLFQSISTLETNLGGLGTTVETISSAVDQNTLAISALQDEDTAIKGDLAAAQADIIANAGGIGQNAQAISDVESSVTALAGNLTAFMSNTSINISALGSRISANETAISGINSSLGAKADLVGGKVPLSQLPETVLNQYNVGYYDSLESLQAAHPTGSPGQYGYVQNAEENRYDSYDWNETEQDWILSEVQESSNVEEIVDAAGNSHEGVVQVNAAFVGLGNVDNTADMDKPVSTAMLEALNGKAPISRALPLGGMTSQFLVKASGTDGDAAWRSLTKTDVNLGNVDNTSDLMKPVSTLQAQAISVVQTALTGHLNDKANPHGVTKQQVGLGNVDNTADMNKPISTPQNYRFTSIEDRLTDLEDDFFGATAALESLAASVNGVYA